MRNFKNLLTKKSTAELYDQDGKLPKLFRTYNKRQYFELFIGLATLMIRGVGILFLVASLLDLYVFSYVLNVRNLDTGKTFLMDKPEWKKYRQQYKKITEE
ncbi:hypothetical protein [Companilactobacillus bobalius]|uniref:Uncharacterized protein n=2 Tax=Companilactobacillus bobalius TaxID=2801451 RepID=A0A202FF27_9LACO|nr:hypothetical protein [Companilactobacillus bobalius]KAE9560481.1 hypothetical protein ATN92_10005 [Companilactobacillus bobalius]KRK83237.1 hypothetical protein FC78_GL002046 [Companilactobacillus bobalius DSM 19674]OVE99074.1 hypothetical protein LKACC16343_00186 [Companilactobacillus bobalius]GEO57049.1 hypothetical protein LBO01_01780 [Companilactobacillus paralimentarius]